MFNVNRNNPLQQMLNNPEQMLNSMINNPQFRQFVEENKNLSQEEICKKFNINPAILNLLK